MNGTQNVLNACLEQNVKKCILTSSMAAIFCNHNFKSLYTENDWADPGIHSKNIYKYSKIMAEKLAWDFYSKLPDDSSLELVSLNPGLIFGNLY